MTSGNYCTGDAGNFNTLDDVRRIEGKVAGWTERDCVLTNGDTMLIPEQIKLSATASPEIFNV